MMNMQHDTSRHARVLDVCFIAPSPPDLQPCPDASFTAMAIAFANVSVGIVREDSIEGDAAG
jgi:hypothetical protein